MKARKIVSLSLVIMIMFIMLGPNKVFAAGGVTAPVCSSWTRVYPAPSNSLTNPINGQVRITASNNGNTHTDIRMLDKNGNVVWSECCAVDCNQIRTFYCGSNVYSIEARSHFYGISITNYWITILAVKL